MKAAYFKSMTDEHTFIQTSSLLERRVVVPAFLALLAVLSYANSFPGAFIQDDIFIVKNNPLVQSLDFYRIFTTDYWLSVAENSGLYRPLTILSLALNRMITGPTPWGFHLVNVILHAGVTLLLWMTLLRCGAPPLSAAIAGLLFAVHPIHTEVVNEAVGRSELLVAIFALLAIYFSRVDSCRNYVLAWSCFFLALLSKEHAIAVLVLIPLFDVWVEGYSVLRRRLSFYLGMLLLVGGWFLLRIYGVDQSGPRVPYSMSAVPLAYLPWGERVLTAFQYQWVYLGKLIYPLKLHAVYSLGDLPPIVRSLWSLRGGMIACLTLGLFSCIAVGARRRQWWALTAAAYVLSFVPTSNIPVPIGVIMAERLAYFPSLWFCATMGWFFSRLFSQSLPWRRVASVTVSAYLIFLATLVGLRNRDFASEIDLWQREVLTNDADFLAWHSYGQSLYNGHRYKESEAAYREMLRLEPEFIGGLRSYFTFLFERRRYPEAISVAQRCVDLSTEQNDVTGAAYDLVNLSTVYLEQRNFSQALSYLEAVDPHFFQQKEIYYSFLGKAYQGVGNHLAAIAAFEKIGSYDLDLNIPLHIAISLFNLGRMEEAQNKLHEAIRLNERAEAWNLLGTIAAQMQNYDEAIEDFGRAVTLEPGKDHYKKNLNKARLLRENAR